MVEDNSPVFSTSASSTPNWAHARWVGRLGTVNSFKIEHPCPLRVHQCVAVTAGGMVPAACTNDREWSRHALSWQYVVVGALFSHLRGFPTFISTMVRASEGHACVSINKHQQLPRKNSKSKLHYLFGSTGQSLWGGTHLPSDVSRFPFPNPPYIGAWQAMAYEYLNAADMNWQADLQNTNLMNPIK